MSRPVREHFSLLDLAVSLEWPPVLDRLGLAELVRFVVPRVTVVDRPGPPLDVVTGAPPARIRFDLGPAGLVVVGDGRAIADGVDPVAAVDAAYGYVHRRAFDGAAAHGWTRVHGAVADLPGGRLIVVGAPGTGKSTLAVQLLLAGIDVSGDEWLLARDGEVVAFPRRFLLDSSALAVLPALADRWPTLATMPATDGRAAGDGRRRAIDPTELGRTWIIEARRPDVIAFLAIRRPGPNVVAALSPLAAAEQLLAQVFDPAPLAGGPAGDPGGPRRQRRGDLVREVCTLVNGASPVTVAVNDLASIAETLDGVVRAR